MAKRFATTQKSKKPRVLTKFWLVAKRFATTFCHKKNRWDFVKISLKFRWQAIQVNEILTKFQRNFNEKNNKNIVAKHVATRFATSFATRFASQLTSFCFERPSILSVRLPCCFLFILNLTLIRISVVILSIEEQSQCKSFKSKEL